MIEKREGIALKGQLNLKVFKHDSLFLEYSSENLVLNNGKNLVANLLVGNSANTKKISQFGFGSNATPPTVTDTIGGTSLLFLTSFKNNITGYSISDTSHSIQINFEVAKTEGNGISIKEFGLFSADGILFNRIVWDRNLVKESSFSLSGNFLITIL